MPHKKSSVYSGHSVLSGIGFSDASRDTRGPICSHLWQGSHVRKGERESKGRSRQQQRTMTASVAAAVVVRIFKRRSAAVLFLASGRYILLKLSM